MEEKNNRVWSNTLSQITGRVAIIFISLFITGVLTRKLGIAGFGDYVFVSSMVLMFTGLSDLGANILGVRDASINKEDSQNIFSGIFSFRIVLSLLLFIIFLVLIFILPQFKNLIIPSAIAAFIIPLLVLKTTGQSVLQTNLRLDKTTLLEIFSSVVFFVFLYLLIVLKIDFSLSYIMFFWMISALCSSIMGYIFLRKYIKLQVRFDKEKIKAVFLRALPLGIYFLVYSFYDKGVDSFLLKTYSSSEALGLYGLAYKIHGNLILGAAFLMNSLFPVISSLVKNKEKLIIIFKKSMTMLITGALIIFIVFFIFSGLMINFISGSTFGVSAGILRILLFATFISYLNHLTGYLLVTLDERKNILIFSFIALTFNIICNLLFIPYFSYWAAAVSTVFTELTMLVLSLRILKKKYQLTFSISDYYANLKLLFSNRQKYFDVG